MTEFGCHSPLVKEVISFVETKQILAKPYEMVDRQIVIPTRTIFSLDGVERFRDPDWPASEVRNKIGWIDIQRIDEGLYYAMEKATPGFEPGIREKLSQTATKLYRLIYEQLDGVLSNDEQNQAGGAFDAIMYVRALFGRNRNMWYEKMFSIYQAGGYPCGWSGQYPEGELIVYSRN